jgi:hypothetical protein
MKTENNHPYIIGKNYFIRTVTHHYTGKLESVFDKEITLSSVAWIADSGRFQQALETSNFSEVEMYPKDVTVIIGRGAILDCSEIVKLPTTQK